MGIKAGDITRSMTLARDDLEFPDGAIYAWVHEDGTLSLARLGGGFTLKHEILEKYEFHEATDEDKKPKYRRGHFTMDEWPMAIPGWHAGHNWNGWAMPEFEKAEAERVLEYFKEDGEPVKWRFDAERDVFTSPNYNEGDPDYEWPGHDIETPEGTKHVYDAGNDGFCWWEERCEGCLEPGRKPHAKDCFVWDETEIQRESVRQARLRDILGLWDQWGFGDDEAVSEPIYNWLRKEVEDDEEIRG